MKLFAFIVWLLSPALAFAYVDPGSGMLIWQSLIAALGFIIMFIRRPLDIVKRIFARIFKK